MTSRARIFANRARVFATEQEASIDPADAGSGGGVTVYANTDTLPLSGVDDGAQAFVTETNRLYLWNGTGWYNIALINQTPTIQANTYANTYELDSSGSNTVIELLASDPEDVPITWTYTTTLTGNTATISQSNNVFTITPSTVPADAGTFSITFKASDGVNIASATSEFTLQFGVNYPLLNALTYSSTVSTTNVVGGSGFTAGYVKGFSGTQDGTYISVAGEYGPAIWEFTTPGTLSTIVKRYSNAVPPNVNGNGGSGATEWNSNGSKVYYMYNNGSNLKILSWNWNGTSLSSGAEIKSLSLPSGWSSSRVPSAMCFNSDGTSLFVVGEAVAVVYKYSVSTPYDLSTMSTTPNQTKLINWASDVVISPDDKYICWKEGYSNTWKQYLFNSPLDLTNITQVASASFSNSGGNTSTIMPIGLRFKLDGSGVLIFDQQNDQIDEYV